MTINDENAGSDGAYEIYLKNLWDSQLSKNFPLAIPFYKGDNLKAEDLKFKDLFSGMALIKEHIINDVIDYIKSWFPEFKSEIYHTELIDASYEKIVEDDQSYININVTYNVLSKDGYVIDRKDKVILSFPFVSSDYTFHENGNRWAFTDDLLKDFSVNFNEIGNEFSEDHYYELDLHIYPKEVDPEQPNNHDFITIYRYFDNFNNGKNSVYIEVYDWDHNKYWIKPLSEVTEEDLKEYDFQYLRTSISRLFDKKEYSEVSDSPLDLINYIVDKMGDSTIFDKDNIRLKIASTGYHMFKDLLFGYVDYLFRKAMKSGVSELGYIDYSTIFKYLHKNPLFFWLDDQNLISYIKSLRRITLNGSRGIDRVPIQMRDYQPSYEGVLDPLETPEGQNLGILNHRALGSRINKDGVFEDTEVKGPFKLFDIPTLEVLFLQNTDVIRCEMATKHISQSLPVENSEVPLVANSMDRILYEKFYKCPESDYDGICIEEKGKVTVQDSISNESKLYKKPPRILSNHKTLQEYYPRYLTGSRISKGSPIYNSNSFRDGYFTLGVNATVAYMHFEGYNYEDGIPVSEELVERIGKIQQGYVFEIDMTNKTFESCNIPKVGEPVNQGDEAVIYRDMGEAVSLSNIFRVKKKAYRYPSSGVLYKAKFYRAGHLCSRKDQWDYAILYISKGHKLEIGDKLSFMSAGKGIISKLLGTSNLKFVSKDMMPIAQDGTPIEILYPTLGIPSRMNLSQLLEAPLALFNDLLRKHVISGISNMDDLISVFSRINKILETENLEYLIQWLDSNRDSFNIIKDSIVNHMVFEVKPFDTTINFDTIPLLYDEFDLNQYFDPRKGKRLYLPSRGKLTQFPVFYGKLRLFCLDHLIDKKLTAVSLPGLSDIKEKEQKIGEMEHIALEAHHASNFINEISLIRSNHDGYSKIFNDLMGSEGKLLDLDDYRGANESLKTFQTYLRALGIIMKRVPNDQSDTNDTSSPLPSKDLIDPEELPDPRDIKPLKDEELDDGDLPWND